MNELFYLQDSRSYVGNDILWWAKGGKGYTTDLSKAEIYTREQALTQHECRETDRPWPKTYIDQRTRPAVDMQYCKIQEALKGTGIKLLKPQRLAKPKYHCDECKQFMSEKQYYSGPCENCECDNRP